MRYYAIFLTGCVLPLSFSTTNALAGGVYKGISNISGCPIWMKDGKPIEWRTKAGLYEEYPVSRPCGDSDDHALQWKSYKLSSNTIHIDQSDGKSSDADVDDNNMINVKNVHNSK